MGTMIDKGSPIVLWDDDDYTERFAMGCDAAYRAIEKVLYGREWEDEFLHTSDAVFEAIGLTVVDMDEVMDDEDDSDETLPEG